MRKSTAGFAAALAVAGAGVLAGTAQAADAPDVIDADVNADHALQNAVQDVDVPIVTTVGDVVPLEDSVNGLTAGVLGAAQGGN